MATTSVQSTSSTAPTSTPPASSITPYMLSIDPFFSLPATVQSKFNALFQSTNVTKNKLVKRVYTSLMDFPEAVQLDMIDTFKRRNEKNTFLQKSVLFMDIMKQREFQRNKETVPTSSPINNPVGQPGNYQPQSSPGNYQPQSSPQSSQPSSQSQQTPVDPENSLPINALFQVGNQQSQPPPSKPPLSQPVSSQPSSQPLSQPLSFPTSSSQPLVEPNRNFVEQNINNVHPVSYPSRPGDQQSKPLAQPSSQPQSMLADRKNDMQQGYTTQLEKTRFQIPEYLMGFVMGKKGSQISEIRSQSGAQIKIGARPEEHGAQDAARDIIVVGTRTQVETAVRMMNSRISIENQQRDRDGHGGDSGSRNDGNDNHGRHRSPGGYGQRRGRDWGGDYDNNNGYNQQRPNRRPRYRY